MHEHTYAAPVRDAQFLLWEQLRIHERLGMAPEARARADASYAAARAFAEGPLAASYADTDAQEAHLRADGTVATPDAYPALMAAYADLWRGWSAPGAEAPPEPLQHLIVEMFCGANPSFVTYIGFNGPAQTLLETYGSASMQARWLPELRSMRASAGLCLTEKQAGSDLSRIACVAEKDADGRYWLTGHKWLISAGSHELTENILYFVLARTDPAQTGMVGLSCFLVPRFRDESFGTADNGVRVREVVRKMGLKGCANTHLTFGEERPTEALLLGEVEGRGLQQLMLMMTPARISTGIFALGLAGAATECARAYSEARVQGKQFNQSMSARAESLPIARHPDVARMRRDMLAVTTGCRAMIARLGLAQALQRSATATAEEKAVAHDVLDVLLPIVKAYTSDQAWRVAETAIQTLGGVGYTRAWPVEQHARDCKVLSIWEGTNHIQSLFLLRDKLGLCLRPKKLETVLGEVRKALVRLSVDARFDAEAERMERALAALAAAVSAIGGRVRAGGMNDVPEFAVEFMAGFAEVVIAWQLIDAALVAQAALDRGTDEAAFYAEKVAAMRHFLRRRLPVGTAQLSTVAWELSQPVAAPTRETVDA